LFDRRRDTKKIDGSDDAKGTQIAYVAREQKRNVMRGWMHVCPAHGFYPYRLLSLISACMLQTPRSTHITPS
jgi:hypothetical protein